MRCSAEGARRPCRVMAMVNDNQSLYDEMQFPPARQPARKMDTVAGGGGRGGGFAAGGIFLPDRQPRRGGPAGGARGEVRRLQGMCNSATTTICRDFATADHARLIAAGAQRAQRRVRILPRAGQPALRVRRRGQAALQLHGRAPPGEQLRRAAAGPARPRDGDGLLPMPRRCARPVQPALPPSGAGRAG